MREVPFLSQLLLQGKNECCVKFDWNGNRIFSLSDESFCSNTAYDIRVAAVCTCMP